MPRRAVSALFLVLAFALPALAQTRDEDFQTLFQRGLDQLKRRQHDEAIETFKRALDLRKDVPEPYYNVACAYSLKGDKERALDWLGQALARGFNDEEHIAKDADLDGIRNEARFKDLVTKAFAKAKPGESLVTLKGEVATLEKLRGKVVLLDFWRTWCEACKQQIPNLAALEKEYGPKGLVVVGVSNEPAALQEQFADELKMNYMLLRQAGALPSPYDGVRAFPTLWILDQEGKVVKKFVGARDRAELEDLVKALLEKKAVPAPAEKGEPQEF